MRIIEEIAHEESGVRTFISANSGNGFYSLYDRVFQNEKFDKIYVILGGPGTGKSTLMRRICAMAKEQDAECTELLCSSDPDSLDGIIICKNKKRIGVLDGTAPHPRILSLPGIKEEIWNLSDFWDEKALSSAKEKILALNKAKAAAYRRAYALLHAACSCHASVKAVTAENTDFQKAEAQIARLLKGCSRRGVAQKCFFRAYSMRGEVIERSMFVQAKEKLVLCGKKHAAELYLSKVSDFLQRHSIEHVLFLSPLCADDIDGVFVSEKNLLITWQGYLSQSEGKKLHTKRFSKTSDAPQRRENRAAEKLEEALLCVALGALQDAGQNHFALEDIYKNAMHFEKNESRRNGWVNTAIKQIQ